MPQCCAFGCYTKPEDGKRLFLLPTGARNEERRKIWIQKINRKNWIPTNNSRLCEAHFTSDQFELNRADGIRKLKPYAIPTIFSHRPMKVGRKPPDERSSIDEITINRRRKQQDSNTSCEEFPIPMLSFPVEVIMGEEMDVESKEYVPSSNAVDITPKKDGGILKEILVEGGDDKTPANGNKIFVHYVGTLTDGTKFDSSREQGTLFDFILGKGSVIKSWDIGVATMKKGEKAVFTCKAEYAYGSTGSPPKIPPNATLIFEIELLDFQGEDLSVKKDGGIIREQITKGEGYSSPNDGALVEGI